MSPAGATDRVPEDECVLAVHGVTKRFPQQRPWRQVFRAPLDRREVTALRDVSFEVRAGEFFGLLGPNGAGKTTLMKVIATLVVPDEGSVQVAGHDVRRDGAAVRAHMSLSLATERGLFWRLSARENLRLFAALHGIPRARVAPRVQECLRDVDLEKAADRMVREFSSGMLQRLLIARALLPQPRLLLLDEPTRSLDPVAAREFRRFLREELAMRRNCAVLLATHDADEAFNLCRRVAILDRGALLAQGSARDLAYDALGSRHAVVTDQPEHPAFDDLRARGIAEVVSRDPAGVEGWGRVILRIPGGAAQAAAVVDALVRGGARVSAVEPVQATLADLLDAVVARPGGEGR